MTMEYRKLTQAEEDIVTRNVQDYTRIFGFLHRECQAPGCKYPLSGLSESFSILGVGSVCSLCHAMYASLQSGGLKNINYFVDLHLKWKKDNDLDAPGRKDRLGL